MIKPTSLWNFIHECEAEDAEYIGRICLALAGKNVVFTRAERIQYLTIAKDNNDMDERIEERREKDRERKRRWKNAEERGGTRKDAEGADSASPSIHPSIHPLQDNNTPLPPEGGDECGGESAWESWFGRFWSEYPAECPRKVDRKKCLAKFVRIMKAAGKSDRVVFAEVMDGLARWKRSETWTKDGGAFIRAPLVWLNGENWKDAVTESSESRKSDTDRRLAALFAKSRDELRRISADAESDAKSGDSK